ncbi:MAG: hypothetical protein II745_01480 [Lachnospiraceae bacterium]|nr:hypothetical protein [Lachnospiraceae bacterium]
MQLNEIRYEQLKNDAAATGAFKRAGERGENFILDTSEDATFQLSGSRQGKGLLSSRDSFYGKKDLLDEAVTAAENADIASQSDISMKNQMMAKAAKDLNEEAYGESKKEGFDLSSENPYEIVTVADKIKVNLAKAGVDVSKMGGISEAAIEDSPEVKAALSKYSEIMEKGGITKESALFMVKNELEPTIDNVYRASFGAAENESSAASMKAADSLETSGQLAPVFEKAYLSPDDLGKDVISSFIENDIPVTPENMNAYTVLTRGLMKENGDEIMAAVSDAIAEGKAAGDAYVIGGLSITDASTDAMRVVKEATPTDVENVVQRGRTLSILTLSAEFSYREDEASRSLSFRMVLRARSLFSTGDASALQSLRSGQNEVDNASLDIDSAKKTLAEASLLMTSVSARSIMRHGLDIETKPLFEVLELLKAENESPLSSENFEKTNAAIGELKDTPIEFLGSYKSFSIMSQTLSTVRDDAVSFRLSYQKAEGAYETFGTQVRKDLGDSIKKAFSNVSDILSSLEMEDNDDNASAVRVLGYNSIEINKENIMSAKASLLEVRQTLNLLRPGTVASMIREGINPLEMSLSELKETAQKINNGNNTPEESFGKFLYKAERTGELSEDELSAYKGIARLIYSVEKTDGAVIGQLMLEGADINLKNMLTGIRSRRHRGMDYTVDDDFGGVSAKDTGSLSISQQIEKAFQAGKMVESADYLNPATFHAAASDGDYLSYTPEEFEERLKNEDAKLSSRNGYTAEEEALEKEYDKESLEEIKKAVSSEKEVYKALERLDIPASPVYLSAMQGLLNDRNFMYRTLFGKRPSEERNIFGETNDKAEEKGLSDVMEDLMRAFGEAVKTPKEMAEAQRKLFDTAEHAMDDMIIEQDITSVDVRGMKQISKSLQILSGMAEKKETYEMPILVADENGTMMLKIVRGEEQEKGAVDLSMVFDNMGSITATIKYENGHIRGAFESDSARTDAILKGAKEALNDAIARESGASSELSISLKTRVNINAVFTDSPSAGEEEDFGFETAPSLPDDDGIETRRLYGIARAVISVLSGVKDEIPG